MYNDNCWIANVSDGSTHTEKWIEGEPSPWRRLMSYCELNRTYVTNLRMTVGVETVSCPSGSVGYWQSNAMPAVQGVECDEELHKWHGIGWVEGETVHIIWGAMDPQTHNVVFWYDERPTSNDGPIIWGNKEILAPAGIAVPVRNVREYASRIDGV